MIAAAAWPPDQAAAPTRRPGDECVVLLHGMGRTAFSMQPLADYLEDAGYRTVNLSYPSTRANIESIAATFIPEAIAACGAAPRRIHFVTHSLGGIVLRCYLQTHSLPPGSRIVMLAPPNQGSELVDRFRNQAWYQRLNGPAGQQLGTDAASLPNRLKPVAGEVGVIAGHRTLEPWFSALIPGADDGKVAVTRTRLAEMRDFLEVDHGHTFIMYGADVARQVRYFLEHGAFQHPTAPSPPE
jgi:triacylglycerol lipase